MNEDTEIKSSEPLSEPIVNDEALGDALKRKRKAESCQRWETQKEG